MLRSHTCGLTVPTLIPKRAYFSDENGWLLMSSRYLNADLRRTDFAPPKLEVSAPQKQQGGWSVNVTASDDVGLRAIVFVDRGAGSIVTGRKLTGMRQSFRQTLNIADSKAPNLQIILTDEGGN